MKRYSFLFLLILHTVVANAQKNYWQQHVATKIEVTLDDKNHFLHGFETLVYTNNSPDTLHYLYMHLWANAYKHDHTPFAEQQYQQGKTKFYYATPSQRGYIDSLNFEADNNSLNFYSNNNTPDIARLDLIEPLLPGAQITITTPFRVKIPKVFSRLGHTKQAYFISQWFPKPAVYDHKGWHPLSYLDQGEFYSEYGSYDVKITLPKNYVVLATGNLITESENKWLDSLAAIPWYDSTFAHHKFTDSIPPSSTEWKTIEFQEEQVHDFAWFADKRYIVRKDTFQHVKVFTAFLPSYKNSWKNGTNYLKDALKIYGENVGTYPYKTIKAVQGDMKSGGGMEYPTITIIDKSVGGSKDVIVHEAGHNWFYGILGSNERDHAWMDEGINTFYEGLTMKKTTDTVKKTKTKTSKKSVKIKVDVNTTVIAQLAASGRDQRINQTSNKFKEINYGMDVYYKAAWYMAELETYMGKENFQKGMNDYFNTWKFKHPYPEDLQAVLEKHTDKPLDWFFNDLLNSNSRIDFALKKAKKLPDATTEITVQNKTNLSLPVIIHAYQNDSVIVTVSTLPFSNDTVVKIPATEWTTIGIAPSVADMKTQNNLYRSRGLWHRSGLSLRFLAGANTTNKQKLFWLPAVGYNMYDGFGAGIVLHNITMPENKFRFIVAPMYSFRSKRFTGTGSMAYVLHPAKTFQEISVQLDAKTFDNNESGLNIPNLIFSRYVKIAPSINFTFKEPTATSPVTRTLQLKAYGINEQYFNYVQDPNDSTVFRPITKDKQLYYGLLNYTHTNARTFNPFGYSGTLQMGKNFMKLMAEANIRIDYFLKNKSLRIRAFAGKFFNLNQVASYTNERYYLNSSFTNVNDYLYDDTYFGRSQQTGFGAQQISMREGGLKIPTPLLAAPLGRSDNWLAALNIKTDLPIKLPIRLFLDVATFANAHQLNPSGDKVLFDAGVEIFVADFINISIPIVMSKDYKDYYKSIVGKNQFVRSITFSLQLNKIKWLNSSSDIFKILGY